MPRITATRVKTRNSFNAMQYKSKLRKRFPKTLNIAAGAVVDDIKRGITYGRTIEGKAMKPLKAATIKAKRKKGSQSPRTALRDTGLMQKVFIKSKATATNQEAQINIAKKRLDPDIARFQHEGTSDIPQRKWFGISPTATKRIKKLFKEELARQLRRR